MNQILGKIVLAAYFCWVVIVAVLPSMFAISQYGMSNRPGDHLRLLLLGACVVQSIYSIVKSFSFSVALLKGSRPLLERGLSNRSRNSLLCFCVWGALTTGIVLLFVSSLGYLGVTIACCGAFLPLATAYLSRKDSVVETPIAHGIQENFDNSNTSHRRREITPFFVLSRVETLWTAGLAVLWIALAFGVLLSG